VELPAGVAPDAGGLAEALLASIVPTFLTIVANMGELRIWFKSGAGRELEAADGAPSDDEDEAEGDVPGPRADVSAGAG